nr:hypothetical protein [Fischerella sp. JS2]
MNTDGYREIWRTSMIALYLEVGDRTPNDEVIYPDDDLITKASHDGKSKIFAHKYGTSY